VAAAADFQVQVPVLSPSGWTFVEALPGLIPGKVIGLQ